MDVSIVVPFYNEGPSVVPLCAAIADTMTSVGASFEVLLIDDGSTDNTFDKACEVATGDIRFRILKLKKNFGQTAALYAGFEHARGDIIVTMDGDLQNDPQDIERLMDKMQEGYDVVTGWREDRKDRLVSRKIPSRVANWLIRKVTGAHVKDNGCALRAYRAEVIKKIPLYSEMHRLLPTMLTMTGVRMAQIQVNHHPRRYGSSKYGLSRVYKVLLDLVALKTIMTSVRWPLFGFGTSAAISGGIAVLLFIAGLVHHTVQPEGSLVVLLGAAMLCGALGLSLLMLGILCSLIYAKGNYKVEDILKKHRY